MRLPTARIPIITLLTIASIFMVTALADNRVQNTTFVEGRVLSAYGALEGARVRLPGRDELVMTDAKGHFRLPIGLTGSGSIRITAGKEGWFNAGGFVRPGSSVDLVLNPLPRTDNQHYQFLSPQVCAQCHVDLSRYYDGSKMAHTASNPKVIQMYNGTDAYNRKGYGPGYKIDNPDQDGDCVVCHVPSVAAANPASQDMNRALQAKGLESDGISCDYCHKIKRVTKNDTTASGFKASFLRQTARSGNSILVMGPYDDVAVPPMAASYNSVFAQGQFCSQCHSHLVNLNNNQTWNWKKVYSTEEWNGFAVKNDSVLPVQTTYQEWQQWQASLDENDVNRGKECQDCHMSWRKEMLPFANHVVNGHARQMWASYRESQRIHPHQFDGGTEIQLKTALSLEIEGEIKGDILTATIYVANTNAGHWVPTGEPMRSVILVLEAMDQDEKPLPMVNGDILPATAGKGDVNSGNYAGLPGVLFAKVLQDAAGNLNVPSWKAVSIAVDNRIRPKSTVAFSWQFKLPKPDNEPTVTARLIYRPVPKELASGKKWAVSDILIKDAAW